MAIEKSELKPENEIHGEDPEETNLLKDMLESATNYVKSFPWCPPIQSRFMALGIGGVVGVFLFRFSDAIKNTDDKELWVVCGDLPSAYLVTEDLSNGKAALREYCNLMQGWIDVVMARGDLAEVYPVDASPTIENAKALKKRIDFIQMELLNTGNQGTAEAKPDKK